MTRERIEDFREIVLPFVKKRLLETNYENLGESDAEMFAKDFNEILDLAIKALEQEPCKDCISREAVLSLFNKSDDYRWETTLIKKKIEKIPPVTPQEPRKGHWTEEFNDLEGEVRFTCSSCGKYQLFGTDFCYHCGSDNREVVEE